MQAGSVREGRATGRRVAAPAHPLAELQGLVGNRGACGLLSVAQPKLEVGPAGDRYEQEADKVARQVVGLLGRGGPRPDGVEEDRRLSVGRRTEVGAPGGALEPGTEQAITSARGGGRPLEGTTRRAMEGAFEADFSNVRIHSGSHAADLNRRIQADAFTIGSDIFFRGGVPDASTDGGRQLLAHELVHTIQQGASSQLNQVSRLRHDEVADVERVWHGSCCHVDGDNPVIQRHSSWEHASLGDMKPETLAQIGTYKDLIAETSARGGGKDEAKITLPNQKTISKGQLMHVLTQEMGRVASWQRKPPTKASTDEGMNVTEMDPTFEVLLVRLPADKQKNQMLVTYGELNTLADFYGNLDVMKSADPGQRKQVVQSVRKEIFLRLRKIYDELEMSLTEKEKADKDVTAAKRNFRRKRLGIDNEGEEMVKFAGAAAPDFISGTAGQVDLLAGDKPLIGQGTGARGATNKYGATLARNACHFVPESWHSWADYHDQARALAKQSHDKFLEAKAEKDFLATLNPLPEVKKSREDIIANLAKDSGRLANDALLANGFGDHYLQDSYASGHMINKTQIMQWYIEFIDKNKEWDYFKDKNWRKVQQMAYGQEGLADPDQYDKDQVKGYDPTNQNPAQPRNPQSVENLGGNDWTIRFAALGLQVPASLRTPGSAERLVVEEWQLAAGKSSSKRKRTGAELVLSNPGLKAADVRQAVGALLADGVVRTDEDVTKRREYMKEGEQVPRNEFAGTTFLLREDYVPSSRSKLRDLKQAQKASKQGDDTAYQRMAKAVTYADYIEFLSSGFIQKSTNALHDTFCKGGLTVSNGLNAEVFKVYGDDRMFKSESSKGVQESGITANMSRDAIVNIINDGKDGGITAKGILDRLPSFVKYDYTDGAGTKWTVTESIRSWHNSNEEGNLKDRCMKTIFPDMSWELLQKAVPGLAGGSLGQITRDKVHGDEAF
jgi:hypothetical protein